MKLPFGIVEPQRLSKAARRCREVYLTRIVARALDQAHFVLAQRQYIEATVRDKQRQERLQVKSGCDDNEFIET
jgi:hypothetical protein